MACLASHSNRAQNSPVAPAVPHPSPLAVLTGRDGAGPGALGSAPEGWAPVPAQPPAGGVTLSKPCSLSSRRRCPLSQKGDGMLASKGTSIAVAW